MNLEQAKGRFLKYVETFDVKEKFIRLKLDHSYRVSIISREIAGRLKLTEEEQELAEVIGLLHDIGRFYQIEKTHGFDDRKLDHSDYGIMYLFDEGHIRDFVADSKYDEIIRKAVLYHNDLSLNEDLSKEEALFCKIIRDADKIDIYRVYVEEFEHSFRFLDISKEIWEEFQSGRPVNIYKKKSKSDIVCCVLAFLHDINFRVSFDILKETGNFTAYVEHVKVAEDSLEEWEKLVFYCYKIIDGKRE